MRWKDICLSVAVKATELHKDPSFDHFRITEIVHSLFFSINSEQKHLASHNMHRIVVISFQVWRFAASVKMEHMELLAVTEGER